jgi:predicted ATPase
VTFVFTDVEGSARLWEERPDEMRELAAEHDTRFRAAIEANHGYVVKATGDGFHAAFARAADAVQAAVRMQEATADLPGIAVRMGVNTGEVQERDGDYFGPAVNRAARLMAAGHGGQVLLSGVTAELVPGLTLTNLGEHRLRDLATPTVVWQLGTGSFPPLRTLDEVPGNLPYQRTSFIGRVDEVQQVAALVESERLVTLTGPGGVGKSRLALQVAADVAPAFPDGAWFVSLGSLAEGALVAPALLDALSVRERTGEDPLATLCAWACRREALVVIDNCEHLLADVARVVDRVADAAPGLRVVATSQEPLGVRGEHVWNVAPLSKGTSGSLESVQLFVDRARMARADFALTAENEKAVVEICEHLDHLPLAIELAAARMRGMAPADVARRLDQRLRLLTSQDRLAPDRHRTLDAAMRWSYDLLDQTQRWVFDRLSVFVGPFTLDAAATVIAGDGVEEWEVLDLVLALVDKSLVLVEESSADTRYRLLESMRQLGQQNLAEVGGLEHYRDRHADFYADYVLSRQPQLHGAGDQDALAAVEGELENIRVAIRQAADDHSSARFEELYCALYPLWIGRGRLSEGVTWALLLRDREVVDVAPRITALGFAANVANGSDLVLAAELAHTAIALAETAGERGALLAKAVLGLCSMMQGRIQEALAACDEVLTEVEDEPWGFARAEALNCAAGCITVCGAHDRLEPLLPLLRAHVGSSASEYQQAAYMSTMAPIIHLIDPDNARDYLLRGYRRTLAIGNVHMLGTLGLFLSLHELRNGRDLDAAEWARRSLELVVENSPTFVAQTVAVAIAVVKRRSLRDAAVLLGALQAHRDRTGQAGSPPEIESEIRYEGSLRRRLGEDFEAAYAEGLALDEPALLACAFARLDEVIGQGSQVRLNDLESKVPPS